MTHIMVPDGVFPLWLWGLGWGGTAVLVVLIGLRAGREDMVRKVPLNRGDGCADDGCHVVCACPHCL